MVEIGLKPGTTTMIGIYAINCPEWILSEQASYCYSMVIVPLYDTLGADACSFIIKQGKHIIEGSKWKINLESVLTAEIQVILVEDDAKCNSLLEKSPRCLKKLIVFKEVRPATKQRAKNLGIEILRLQDVELLGSKANHPEIVNFLINIWVLFIRTLIISASFPFGFVHHLLYKWNHRSTKGSHVDSRECCSLYECGCFAIWRPSTQKRWRHVIILTLSSYDGTVLWGLLSYLFGIKNNLGECLL